MMRHFRLTTLVALFVVISAVAVAAAPYAYVSQSGTSSVFIVNTGTTPPSAADATVPPIAVPAGRMPWGVALSPDGGTLYVANFAFAGGSVMAFNTSDGSLIRDVPVGALPFGVAVHPTNGDVYATVTFNGSKVVAIHASTFINLGALPAMTSVAMPSPRGVAVNPAGTLLYVTSFATDSLYVFNLPINPLEEPTVIPLSGGVRPLGVAVSPDGSKVYVADRDSNNLAVLNAMNNYSATYVPVGNGPIGVAVSPDGLEVYVTNSMSGTVSVLDAAGSPIGSEIVVGVQPFGIATDGAYVYVAVFNTNGKIWVIDRATRAKTYIDASFPIGFGKFVNPAMKYAFAWQRPTNSPAISVNAGSTVPVRWTITNANGAAISDLGVVTEITSAPCPSGSSTAAASARIRASSAGGSDLRYNTDHFMFNWKTDKAWVGSCRQFIVQLNDGSSHSLTFQFR